MTCINTIVYFFTQHTVPSVNSSIPIDVKQNAGDMVDMQNSAVLVNVSNKLNYV